MLRNETLSCHRNQLLVITSFFSQFYYVKFGNDKSHKITEDWSEREQHDIDQAEGGDSRGGQGGDTEEDAGHVGHWCLSMLSFLIRRQNSEKELLVHFKAGHIDSQVHHLEWRNWVQRTVAGKIACCNVGQGWVQLQLVEVSVVCGVEDDELLDNSGVQVGPWGGEAQAELLSIKVGEFEVPDGGRGVKVVVRPGLSEGDDSPRPGPGECSSGRDRSVLLHSGATTADRSGGWRPGGEGSVLPSCDVHHPGVLRARYRADQGVSGLGLVGFELSEVGRVDPVILHIVRSYPVVSQSDLSHLLPFRDEGFQVGRYDRIAALHDLTMENKSVNIVSSEHYVLGSNISPAVRGYWQNILRCFGLHQQRQEIDFWTWKLWLWNKIL